MKHTGLGPLPFDRIFLSVGTEEQKTIIRTLFPALTRRYGERLQIITDGVRGERIGSGGAVLRALYTASPRPDFSRERILVVNCGGYSSRLACYSFGSKALVPVGGGEPILSRLLKNAGALSSKIEPGLLVCCSDIIIDTSDLAGKLTGNTSFCVDAPKSVGSRHGVMFADAEGLLTDYCQKCSEDVLSEFSAGADPDTVPVEAGWTYFSSATAVKLAAAAGRYTERRGDTLPFVSLYEDILPLFASNFDRDAYLRSDRSGFRQELAEELLPSSMKVVRLRQPFRHYGTLPELLSNLRSDFPDDACFISHSARSGPVTIGRGSLLDHVRISGNSRIGENCVLCDMDLADVTVPDRYFVFGLRLRDGRSVAVCGRIEDSPESGAAAAEGLWTRETFFPAGTFSESFGRYFSRPCGAETLPLGTCLEKADAYYYAEWRLFLEELERSDYRRNERYESYRLALIGAFRDTHGPLGKIRCQKERASLDLPVRINFTGTWTDCMPYCIDNGGAVVNAAIRVDGRLPVRVTAERIPGKHIELRNGENPDKKMIYDPCAQISDFSEYSLHRAVIRTLGIGPRTVIEDGVRLTVQVSGLIKGSGLGTSSILLYGCFSAVGELLGLEFSEEERLLMTFTAEQFMRTGGGWQDQGAVVGGGIKTVSAEPGYLQHIRVTQLPAADGFLRSLSDRLVLISAGQRHFGRFIVSDVMARYLAGDRSNLRALNEIRELNAPLARSVRDGDTELFAQTANSHSELLTKISPLIYNSDLKDLRDRCMRYLDACCICGAGGGGYLWGLRKENCSVQDIQRALGTGVKRAEII